MGGRRSGHQFSYNGKPETNDSMPLDIRKITRKGLLVPGNSFSWQWLVCKREVAGISIQVDLQSVMLSFRMKSTDELVEQRVQTQSSPCNLGSTTGLRAHGAASVWRCFTRWAGTLLAACVVGWDMPRRKKALATAQ